MGTRQFPRADSYRSVIKSGQNGCHLLVLTNQKTF